MSGNTVRETVPTCEGRGKRFYVTSKRVAETEAFGEEFLKRFNADLMRLGVEARMIAMKLI